MSYNFLICHIYVAYQKNAVYALIKLSAKSHSFNILCTMDGLSCPTIMLTEISDHHELGIGFMDGCN